MSSSSSPPFAQVLEFMQSTNGQLAAFALGIFACIAGFYIASQYLATQLANADSIAKPTTKAEGTKFVEEEGHLVRRSTRAKKPVESLSSVASPVRTPLKTKEAEAVKGTPKASKGAVAAVQMQSLKTPVSAPPRTRSLAAAAQETTVVEPAEEAATPKARRRMQRV
ncbi:MAG: hypothetical protein WDW38_002222 [Sanguina aurantia]